MKCTPKVGDNFWRYTSLLSAVVIPPNVTEIGKSAFVGCHSLLSIEFGGTVAQWEAVKRKLELLKYIPATVVKCADGEWQKPILLVEDGVAVECLGESATSVTIPEGGTEIGADAFRGCTSLSSVVIPEGVTTIGYEAFMDCTSLSSVVIPEGVTKMGYYAFRDCKSLESVVIPEGVTTIGEDAFMDCTSLSSVEFGGTVAQWEAVKKVGYWNQCVPAKSVKCADGEAALEE